MPAPTRSSHVVRKQVRRRDRHRQRRRVRQVDPLGRATSMSRLGGLEHRPDRLRRRVAHGRRRRTCSSSSRTSTPEYAASTGLRERRARGGWVCTGARSRTRAQDELQRDIDNLQAALAEVERRPGGSCRSSRRRASSGVRWSDELVRDGGGVPLRRRRRAARGVQGDPRRRARRCRSTTRSCPWMLRPDGPAGDAGRVPRRGRSCASTPLNHALRGLPAGADPLPHLLGKLQRAARRRRAGCSDIIDLVLQVDAGSYLDRDGQPAPRARVAHLGGREASRRARCSSRA